MKTGSPELYAVVCHAATASLEPGRRPIVRGKDEESEEAIYRASPQLAKLLKSEFAALVVGHKADGKIHHTLPSQPARIHSFVYRCQPDEIGDFSQSFGFLDILLGTSLPVPQDELVSACLRQMRPAHQDQHAFLIAAGKYLAARLSGDFIQLKAILERIKQ